MSIVTGCADEGTVGPDAVAVLVIVGDALDFTRTGKARRRSTSVRYDI